MAIELWAVQFGLKSSDFKSNLRPFEITCMISDQIALHSVQLPLFISASLHFHHYSFHRLSICVASPRTFSFTPYGVSPITFVLSSSVSCISFSVHFFSILLSFLLELSHWEGTNHFSRQYSKYLVVADFCE